MNVAVSAGYGALVALLYLALSVRVILYRRGNRISLGDAGDPVLLGRIRAMATWPSTRRWRWSCS